MAAPRARGRRARSPAARRGRGALAALPVAALLAARAAAAEPGAAEVEPDPAEAREVATPETAEPAAKQRDEAAEAGMTKEQAATAAALKEAEVPEAEARAATPLPSRPGFAPNPERWRPPLRDDDASDWILLSSGEWIRGTMNRINDDTVYFDSEEFGDVEVDWTDVVQMRSSRIHTYRLVRVGSSEDTIVSGTAAMVDGILRIESEGKVVEFKSAAMLGMIEAGQRERDYWSFDGSLGLTLRSGNTDQSDLTLSAKIQRETALTRGYVDYYGSFSSVDGTRTANNHRASARLDYFLTRRLYLVAPFVEVFRDVFQNIALRTTAGAGLGYQLVDSSWLDWEIDSGFAYQRTNQETAPVGVSPTSNDAALSLGTTVALDPLDDVDWDTSYQIQLVVTDFDRTNHNLSSTLSIEIWGPFDLDVTAVWDRIFEPALDADGNRPESDDLRLTVGIGLEF